MPVLVLVLAFLAASGALLAGFAALPLVLIVAVLITGALVLSRVIRNRPIRPR